MVLPLAPHSVTWGPTVPFPSGPHGKTRRPLLIRERWRLEEQTRWEAEPGDSELPCCPPSEFLQSLEVQ